MTNEDLEGITIVLEDQLAERIHAANEDNRVAEKRDAYMFFQGAMMGMTIAYKQVKTHYENSAWEKGTDPTTGEKIEGHGNA